MIKTQIITLAKFEETRYGGGDKKGELIKGVYKAGPNKGNDWQMYTLIDENGTEYTAFDNKYELNIGKTFEITYEETMDGKYTKRTIVTKTQAAKKEKESIAMDRFKQLVDKIDQLQTVVDQIATDLKNRP